MPPSAASISGHAAAVWCSRALARASDAGFQSTENLPPRCNTVEEAMEVRRFVHSSAIDYGIFGCRLCCLCATWPNTTAGGCLGPTGVFAALSPIVLRVRIRCKPSTAVIVTSAHLMFSRPSKPLTAGPTSEAGTRPYWRLAPSRVMSTADCSSGRTRTFS